MVSIFSGNRLHDFKKVGKIRPMTQNAPNPRKRSKKL